MVSDMNKDKNDLKQVFTTQSYYIAYFDILGYKAYFEDNENDIQELLRNTISMAKDTASLTQKFQAISSMIRYKLFSDNCIILLENNDYLEQLYLLYLINIVTSLQLVFLKEYGICIRGGITKGQAYMDDEIVFGKGLIDAVQLEAEKAKDPRIIFDVDKFKKKSIIKDLMHIKKDIDGIYYIDLFSVIYRGNIFYRR